jgi:uncharacterized protein YjbJ (UPF0337 family)
MNNHKEDFMNKDIMEGKWNEIKGNLQKTWGKVTDDEWEQTKGDSKAIAGILQQKYGYAKEDANDKVSEFMRRYTSETQDRLDEEKSRDKLI